MGLDVMFIEFVKDGDCYYPLDLNNTRDKLLFDVHSNIVIKDEVSYFDTTDIKNTTVLNYDELPEYWKNKINPEDLNSNKTVLVRHDDEYSCITGIVCTKELIETEYKIPFKETEFICRKTNTQKLYDEFIGTCWYAGEVSELDHRLTRRVVLPNELDELKKCFDKNSNIQNITFRDNEYILLDF